MNALHVLSQPLFTLRPIFYHKTSVCAFLKMSFFEFLERPHPPDIANRQDNGELGLSQTSFCLMSKKSFF